jgi:hypothetical protein
MSTGMKQAVRPTPTAGLRSPVVRRWIAAVLGLVLCAGAVGCGASDDDTADGGPNDAVPAPVLDAALRRSTLFDTRREIGLALATTGDVDVHLGTIQLITPLFETLAPTTRDATLAAGDRARVMPIPFGTARCDGAEEDAPEIAAVVEGEEVRVPVTEHPADLLANLHDRECASAAVLEDVSLELTGAWTVTDPYTADGQLTVTQRTSGVIAEVDEVLGNVIFGVTTATASPVLTVDDDQPSASVGVTISAARCDPHALTEYKRIFVFVVEVRVGDGDPVRVDVVAAGEAHAALSELLRSCVA